MSLPVGLCGHIGAPHAQGHQLRNFFYAFRKLGVKTILCFLDYLEGAKDSFLSPFVGDGSEEAIWLLTPDLFGERRMPGFTFYFEYADDYNFGVCLPQYRNNADAIICPTQHNAKVLRQKGWEGCIIVNPLGVDTSLYRRGRGFHPQELDPPDFEHGPWRGAEVKFLNCNFFQRRKGLLDLLLAWREASKERKFREKAGLLIKSAPSYWGRRVSSLVQEFVKENPRLAPICLYERMVTEEELALLFRTCQVYISPHREEGFGFAIVQALASGLPVIYTDHGGPKDHLTEEVGWKVPFSKIEPVPPSEADGSMEKVKGYFWVVPNRKFLKQALLRAALDEKERKEKMEKARPFSLKFSWEKVARSLLSKIEQEFGISAQDEGKCRGEKDIVSCVIPTDLHSKVLHKCLLSARRNCQEVVVVVDSPSGDLPSSLKKLADRIIYTRGENVSLAREEGAKCAQGDIIVLLDDDVEIKNLKEAIKLAKRKDVGFVTPLVIKGNKVQQTGVLHPPHIPQGVWRGAGDPVERWEKVCDQIPSLVGTCMVTKKEVLRLCGTLGEVYKPFHCEDTELTLRARLYGLKNFFCGRSKVVHYAASSSQKMRDEGTFAQLQRKHEEILIRRIKNTEYIIQRSLCEVT